MKKQLLLSALFISITSYTMNDDHAELVNYNPQKHSSFIHQLLTMQTEDGREAPSETKEAMFYDGPKMHVDDVLREINAPHRKTIILRKAEKSIGFITYARRNPGILDRCFGGRPDGAIELLAVKQSDRKNGHGARLVQAALDDLGYDDDIEEVCVLINPANKAAEQLYKSLRFEEAGSPPWAPKKLVRKARRRKKE